MAKGAATEQQVAGIQKLVAEVITSQLQEVIQVNPEEEDDELKEFMFTASPALLTMAARFVKDCDIGIDVEEFTQQSATRIQLEAIKASRGKIIKLSDITPVAANG